jgi:hypothetical protein
LVLAHVIIYVCVASIRAAIRRKIITSSRCAIISIRSWDSISTAIAKSIYAIGIAEMPIRIGVGIPIFVTWGIPVASAVLRGVTITIPKDIIG